MEKLGFSLICFLLSPSIIVLFFCQAVIMATANKESGGETHHRYRRTILEDHNLAVYANPYLNLSYYFNPNEDIEFEIRASYNGTGNDITDINIALTSEWLDLSQGSQDKGQFTGVTAATVDTKYTVTFNLNTLTQSGFHIGKLTARVKPNISPLSNLLLTFTVNATYDSNEIYISDGVSTPTIYGSFLDINMTRSLGALEVYNDMAMQLTMVLPEIDFFLLVELTTNIEDYIFMALSDVTKAHGSAITFNGTGNIVQHSAQQNNEVDRVEIDFGFVTVAKGSTEEDRRITIDFKLQIDDHQEVANGSVHYMGAGLQAGPSILWVEQYPVEVIKIGEPALNFSASSNHTVDDERLYIGDAISFNYDIAHMSTSDGDADDVFITVCSEYLSPGDSQVSGITFVSGDSNDTCSKFTLGLNTNKLNKGQTDAKSIQMKINKNITPLLTIQADVTLWYKKASTMKRPIKHSFTFITGTPLIHFEIGNQTNSITPSAKLTFYLSIYLTRMRSPIVVEAVLPKVNNKPIMYITSMTLKNYGSNIKNLSTNAIPSLRNTTSMEKFKDQAVFDLGIAYNEAISTADSPENRIDVEFEARLNDFANVSNTSSYWVGAGILGKPKMVWVGQLSIGTFIREDAQPFIDIDLTTVGAGDEYQYDVSFTHTNKSVQFAGNVTFEYYLPPYVEFVEALVTSPDIEAITNTRYRYKPELLYFMESFNHSIKVKLNRDKSPKTGDFNFTTLVRVSFSHQYTSKEWEYLKGVERNIQVLPRGPVIKTDARAPPHYYGRGFYFDKTQKKFYVCFNMHVPTSTAACYLHHAGSRFIPMDRRLGCILGMDGGEMYGLARNQITPMKFDAASDDWYPLPDIELPPKSSFTFKDLSAANNLGAVQIPQADLSDDDGTDYWQGTGDGIYYKGQSDASWTKRAKWHFY